MSFLVSSKTFLFEVIDLTWSCIQLVGSTIRYAWIIATQTIKASWRLKRPISIDSYVEIINAKTAELEERTFDKVIAHIFRGWAYLEITFDYTNLFIINTFATDETRLPVSLKAKMAFYKRHFRMVPSLQAYQNRAFAIVEEANRLKVARHDIIHGIAIRETPPNIRHYLRHDYRGKKLIKQTKIYSLDEARKTSSEMFALAKLNLALLREIGGSNLAHFFEKSEGLAHNTQGRRLNEIPRMPGYDGA